MSSFLASVFFLHPSDVGVLLGLSNLRHRRTHSVPFASYLNNRFLAVLYLFERSVYNFGIIISILMRHRTGKTNHVSARHPYPEK